MPLKYWAQAFLSATHLINILPSKVINFDTPVECLLKEKPDYNSLRIFDCACWPNLRPYNSGKLSFRSARCVFLGYSSMHKGLSALTSILVESIYPGMLPFMEMFSLCQSASQCKTIIERRTCFSSKSSC